ncbi:hypothetical protein GvMRE_IIg46 [endosymbiont GvMRE of Glomus versiforme]|nr:hypothetical protein GvMRE_IIg46 [endosymbiont GvMRE of Glomus versiforme]
MSTDKKKENKDREFYTYSDDIVFFVGERINT